MMKKNILIAALIIAVIAIIFSVKTTSEPPVEEVSEEVAIEEVPETLEQQAYRIETTVRTAPELFDEARTEIWDLEETVRVAQAKIRKNSNHDGQKFSDGWNEYKKNNEELFTKLEGLKDLTHMKRTGKWIKMKFGEESSQHQTFQSVSKQKKDNSITRAEFYKALSQIK